MRPRSVKQLDLLVALAAAHRGDLGRRLYRSLLDAVAADLEATYCRIVLVGRSGSVRSGASSGHRPGREFPPIVLSQHSRIRSALAHVDRVTVIHDTVTNAPAGDQGLFSPETQRGLIVPFGVHARVLGALVIGEERASRRPAICPDYLDAVQLLAVRVGRVIVEARSARARRLAERRRMHQRVQQLERARLSRQLHDSVGQSVNALLISIRLAVAKGAAGTADLKLLELGAQELLDSARALAYEVRRPSIDPLAVTRLSLGSMMTDAGVTLEWRDQRDGQALPTEVAAQAAAVIRESVMNAWRHGKARTIAVNLGGDQGILHVAVRDDGVGFVPESAQPTPDGRGLGLLSIEERVAAVGGVVRISSKPGSGTTVRVDVPLSRRSTQLPLVGTAGQPATPRPLAVVL